MTKGAPIYALSPENLDDAAPMQHLPKTQHPDSAYKIALSAFAQAHEPLPELPALCPAPVPLALPSVASAVSMTLAPGLVPLALWLLGCLYAPLRCRWLSVYILTSATRSGAG